MMPFSEWWSDEAKKVAQPYNIHSQFPLYKARGKKMTMTLSNRSNTKHIGKLVCILLPLLLTVPTASAQQDGEGSENEAAGEMTQLSRPLHPDGPKQCCILHPFLEPPDGNTPESGLVMDAKGVLYGTTYNGGTALFDGEGIVYLLAAPSKGKPQNVETILYTFGQSDIDGADPMGSVTLGSDGEIYGTTVFGGTQNQGTVYRLKPPASKDKKWTEEVLYSFGTDPVDDGANPLASLLLYKGNLYGTTSIGGNTGCEGVGCGNVFELSPPVAPSTEWTETIIHQFSGSDGALSYSNLIVDDKGNLYGTTSTGGASGNGTVFELNPPKEKGKEWTESVMLSFNGGDGANPMSGLIFDDSGALYGVTFNGGGYDIGVVFKLSPPAKPDGKWEESVLHSFVIPSILNGLCYTCTNNGSGPYGNLAITKEKVIYGTTVWGGGENDAGTIFRLSPPSSPGGKWTETVLHQFTGTDFLPAGSDNGDGFNPYSGLLLENGVLYGTAKGGGAFNLGDVFSFTP